MSDPEVIEMLDHKIAQARDRVESLRLEHDTARTELQRLEKMLEEYMGNHASFESNESPEAEKKVRPERMLKRIFANGARLTKDEFGAALLANGWKVTFYERELNKTINSNLKAGNLLFDGVDRYYIPG